MGTPNLGVGNNLLTAVDAVSPTDAWAVGLGVQSSVDGSTRQTLVEHWDGTSWSIVASPNVGSSDNALTGIGSDSPTDMWAVGYTDTAAGYRTLIEHWDGTAWTVVADPTITAGDNVLTSVSATAANAAWAVGYVATSTGYRALVEQWNGTSWTQAAIPQLQGPADLLRGVVAVSSSDVWATGSSYKTDSGTYQGLSFNWDGTKWAVQRLGTSELRGVASVPAAGQVWTVGIGAGAAYAATSCSTPPGASPVSPSVGAATVGSVQQAGAGPTRAGPISGWSAHSPSGPPGLPGAARATGQAQQVTEVDVAQSAHIAQMSNSFTAAVGDFAGNGRQDIFLSGGSARGGGDGRGELYMNDGAGHFTRTDVMSFPVADRRSCVTGDANGDGMLDIFCSVGANYGTELKSDNLFVQGPAGAFTDQAPSLGVMNPLGRGGAATFIDVNGDGRPDLFVGVSDPVRSDGLPSSNRLFINTPTGFVDGPQYGLDLSIGASCAHSGDYDGDGFQDLLVCSNGGMHLFHNNGGTQFTDVTAAAGLPTVHALDAQFADLNGDGLLDIVMVTSNKLVVLLQGSNHTFTQSFSMPLTAGAAVGHR